MVATTLVNQVIAAQEYVVRKRAPACGPPESSQRDSIHAYLIYLSRLTTETPGSQRDRYPALRLLERKRERAPSSMPPSNATAQTWPRLAMPASRSANQLPELIIPAPTVTPVASSIRMNEPVVRFFE
jgi:hypothetical protein